MIENMRGRSTETKYGRIPLWLYEAGVSLQAIATYGWLHGKYGHFERVVPSYATLAKELKVSRGSIIAYVKELVAVGAVRIVTSGAVGQTTNLYEIAFNEPFPVQSVRLCGGQNADQVVSGLYSPGQHADQGGQPTVQEEDVPKKTKKTLSPRLPRQQAAKPAAAPQERETTATPTNNQTTAAQRAIRTTAAVPRDQEQAFIAWITAKHTPRGPGWWRAATNDLPELAQMWLTEQATTTLRPAGPALPPVCPRCEADHPAARFNANLRFHDNEPCPDCHPDGMPAAA